MTINDFIKECKKLFGDDIEYKVTTKDGIVFKQTKGWRDDKVGINQRQLTSAYREAKKS
jgi:hypothetical protein